MTSPAIPFFPPDLFEGDRDVLVETVHAIGLDPRQRFILGERVARLEAALRAWTGAAEVIACGSGTAALTLILRALDIGPGDEVVVPALGAPPLAACVVNLGASPVFADVDPATMVVDPAATEAAITWRTRALVPAHLFSVMADMPRMRGIAEGHGLRLVEDSAVAAGAILDGRPAGRWGEAGLFSFVQVKTFGMPGEGGVVLTDDADLARTVRTLRNHGQDGVRFVHHRIGYNSRFDEVLAAFQLHRLPGLAARLERRAQIADYYTETFAPLADRGIAPPPPGRNGRCHYVYTLLTEHRDELAGHLAAHGVGTHVYYPVPLPRQPAFAPFAPPDRRWPRAEAASRRMLSIPIHPHLTDTAVEHIASVVCAFAEKEVTAS